MNNKIKKCKEGAINSSIMSLIVFILFCFESVTLFMIYEARGLFDAILPFIIFGLFIIAGIFFTFKRVVRNIRCRHSGKIVKAVVLGYFNDNVEINDKRAYLIKLLVHNDDGDETIYYRTWYTTQDYTINSEIELFKCKDQYLIKDAKKNIFFQSIGGDRIDCK